MSLFPRYLLVQAKELLHQCRASSLKITIAESCTGGLIFSVLTEIAGASLVLCDGFITYSNVSKVETLGVPMELLQVDGPVSESVARAMVNGALSKCSDANLAVAVTGAAGQDSMLPNCDGLVHLAAAHRGFGFLHQRVVFIGNRTSVRLAVTSSAINMLMLLATYHS